MRISLSLMRLWEMPGRRRRLMKWPFVFAGTNYYPYLAYGTFLFKQGQSTEALEASQQASALAPGEINVCFQLARILYQLRRFEVAEQVLKNALVSSDCRVHNLMAKVFAAPGNSQAAAQEVEQPKSCFNANAARAAKPQSAKEPARRKHSLGPFFSLFRPSWALKVRSPMHFCRPERSIRHYRQPPEFADSREALDRDHGGRNSYLRLQQ